MLPENRIPTHPGEILLEEFLIPMELSQVAFAKHIRVPLQRINEIVRGKRGITPGSYDLARSRPERQVAPILLTP